MGNGRCVCRCCTATVRHRDKLLKACGIASGFTLRDLTKPDPRRVRRNLSAIINFHKFREERLAVFAQFTERGVSAEVTRVTGTLANGLL